MITVFLLGLFISEKLKAFLTKSIFVLSNKFLLHAIHFNMYFMVISYINIFKKRLFTWLNC